MLAIRCTNLEASSQSFPALFHKNNDTLPYIFLPVCQRPAPARLPVPHQTGLSFPNISCTAGGASQARHFPAEIEQESFRRIEAECDLHRTLSAPHWRVARRLIHTTADMHIADTLVFRHDPVAAGLAALRRKAPIFCDSQMLRSGLSLPKLRTLHPGYGPEDLHCYITDPDVVERARAEGHTRALCSAEKARPLLDGGIVLIGNAPLALARIARYILEEGVRPALVVGMPVGFVNVVESKDLLARGPVPQIVLEGRRGGSALAVTTLHAVMESA